jgi:hypothetical protein
MFQQDNALPHTTRVNMDFLTQNNINYCNTVLHLLNGSNQILYLDMWYPLLFK